MLVKNSLVYGTLSIVRGLLGFLVVTVYTRLLPPADYGDYAIIVAIIGFADAFAFLWLRHAIMRHITHKESPGDRAYLANAGLLYLLMCAASLVICAALTSSGMFAGSKPGLLYELLGFQIVAEAVSNLAIVMARIRLQHRLFFALNIIKSGLILGFGVLLIEAGYGVVGAAWALLLAALAACVIGLVGTKDFRSIGLRLINRKILRDIGAFGLPLVIVLSVQSGVRATDRLLLDYLIGGDVTGLYSAAQDIPFRLLNLAMMAIHLAAYPLAVQKLDHEGEESCRAQLVQNYTLLMGIALPSVVGMTVLAPGLANIFVGEAFRPFLVEYLGWFALLAFINCFIQYYLSLSFNFAKKTNALVFPFLGALLINFIVSYFGILIIGMPGAIAGCFLAYIFLLGAVIWMARKIFPMPLPLVPTAQIALGSVCMAVSLWVLGAGDDIPGFALSALVGGVVYASVLFLCDTGGVRAALAGILKERRAQP